MMTVGLRPAAFGPGDLGPAAQDSAAQQPGRAVAALTASAPAAGAPQTAVAVRQAEGASDAAKVADKRPADTRSEDRRADGMRTSGSREADKALPADLIAPQPPEDGRDGTPEASASVPRIDPAGPLRTFAQIPMEVVREISRLREEAAQAQAAGVPGRNDPTPMPARPEAIGARMPYDAA